MSAEYIIRYHDGSEVGPFDEATIQSMKNSGEISSSSEVIQTVDQEGEAWFDYLTQLTASDTTYDQLSTKDRQRLERYFAALNRKGPSMWDGSDLASYRMILQIEGRKQIMDEHHKYEIASLTRSIAGHLERIEARLRSVQSTVNLLPNLLIQAGSRDLNISSVSVGIAVDLD
ncbi:hypothetical protein KBB96_04500 [Luteolibacter ambystomatis]|uniref:GYF domain-containing protein n=1 Tax=Luteolibacter ambystomatis TaxID=2824561 RepID=A0A975J1A1_9BACT|nr:hypothetical protein [Luteolibacter ambystomatis]QUE52154.1 hypothetical protein KBB96_04500 [Luteolibacter ambystomatis]